MAPAQDLGARVALVTGGSRGIGAAVALMLARAGAAVAVNYRERAADAEAVVANIKSGGGRAIAVAADVSQSAAVAGMIERVGRELGPIDILVNNAGIAIVRGIDELSESDFDRTILVNLKSAFLCTQAVLPSMRARKWGRIVNITGKSEPDGVNGAFAAKAAMHAWAKGLSREVGKAGITVNSIPPGRIMSEQIRRKYSEEFRAEQSANEIPVGRYGEPEELAALAVFLCSPLARYITGTVMPVDGGLRKYAF